MGLPGSSVSSRPWMMAQASRLPFGCGVLCTTLLGTYCFSLSLGSGRLALGWGIGEGSSGMGSSPRPGRDPRSTRGGLFRETSGLSRLIPSVAVLLLSHPHPAPQGASSPSRSHPSHHLFPHSQSVPPGAGWRGHSQLPATLWLQSLWDTSGARVGARDPLFLPPSPPPHKCCPSAPGVY